MQWVNTRDVDPMPIWRELATYWPDLDWTDVVPSFGASHVVGLMGDDVVRVCFGNAHRARARREVLVTTTVADLGLPFPTPVVRRSPVHTDSWSAVASSRIPGSPPNPGAWHEARLTILPVVEAFTAVTPRSAALGPPREWCGGAQWPAWVDHITASLSCDEGQLAARLVATVLAQEADVTPCVLHGDLGPHNTLLLDGALSGVIDVDYAAVGDPAIDVAPLLGWYSPDELTRDIPAEVVDRARIVKAALPLLSPSRLTSVATPHSRHTPSATSHGGAPATRRVLEDPGLSIMEP